MTFPFRWTAIAPGAIALAGLWGLVAAGPAGTAPRPHPAAMMTERPPATPARYWTRARMAAARDAISGAQASPAAEAAQASGAAEAAQASGAAVGIGWSGGGAVARSTGRVFFTLDGTDYSCSGSAVAGAGVVVTAAHCVSDGAGRWATHWVFVPGYRDGRQPYGSYPARRYVVAAGWAHGGNEDDDVAFVVVNTARVHGVTRTLAAAVGGQRIGFGYRGTVQTVFGYPSAPPYSGRQLDYCAGTLFPDPYGSADAGLNCSMTEGGSGGPWFSGFDPRTGRGTITGVTTFRYANNSLALYSANLGATARTLYEQALYEQALYEQAQRVRN